MLLGSPVPVKFKVMPFNIRQIFLVKNVILQNNLGNRQSSKSSMDPKCDFVASSAEKIFENPDTEPALSFFF